MTKKTLTLALASMMLVTGSAMAQKPVKADCKAKADTCSVDECKRAGKPTKHMRDKQSVILEEFEGLELTDVQKEKLMTLKQKQMEEQKARHDSLKAQRKAEKEASKLEKKEEKKDMKVEKEKAKEKRLEMKAQREAERRAYLQDVKEIVGDENYVIFLENQYVQSSSQNGQQSSKFGAPGQNRKPDAKFDRGAKGGKPQMKGPKGHDGKPGKPGKPGSKDASKQKK